jgi:hypothetical protein
LRDVLGPDKELALAYLKFKRLLPTGATSLEQIPAAFAQKLVANPTVSTRMKLLGKVAAIVRSRYAQATAYFVARSYVQANEHWFAAKNENLDKVLADSEAFARALESMPPMRNAA